MQPTHLLDIIIRQRTPILQLFPGEDQPLLVRRDALLILDLRLDIVDGVGRFDLEGDGLAGEGFDEALRGWVSSRTGWGTGRGEGTSALWLRVEVSNEMFAWKDVGERGLLVAVLRFC